MKKLLNSKNLLKIFIVLLIPSISFSGPGFRSNLGKPSRLTLLAGTYYGSGSCDGAVTAARFSGLSGIAMDSSGNYYVADSYNHIIRKITSAGVVTTLAGVAAMSGTADGTGSAARFNGPSALVVDASGNIYVADTNNHAIRKITSAGVVTTFAGTAGSTGSTNATGTSARFNSPSGIVIDSGGNFFISDKGNYLIRKITSAGVVTTFAGTAATPGTTNGTGSAARFGGSLGLAIDSSDNVYIADAANHLVRKMTSGAVVTTLAGAASSAGTTDGTGTAAKFNNPTGLAVDSSGNVYVGDSGNSTIRKITSAGVVTTLAGLGGTSGSTDATGTAARFNGPSGVVLDSSGNLFVADKFNNVIRKVTSAAVVTTFAGAPYTYGTADGKKTAALFNAPFGITVDSSKNVFVVDSQNNTIRKITQSGDVTTFVGLAGTSGAVDGTGTAARFFLPVGIVADSADNLYVADSYNQAIRKITPAGVVTTFAGTMGSAGVTDGTGSAARFFMPYGLTIDSSGNLYTGDMFGYTIRKITPAGVVTTLAGGAYSSGSTDATGTSARFGMPAGLAVDSADNVYVADLSNFTIRKITPAGVVTTFAGTSGSSGVVDGTGSAARFLKPYGVAADSFGNIYVADTDSHTIRKITSAGVVTTKVGVANKGCVREARVSAAYISSPQALAIRWGMVYFTTSQGAILKFPSNK